MMCEMRAKRGAPLSKVVLAIALGAGRHAMAHAHGYHHLSSGSSAGHAAAPAPAPPGYEQENGGGAGGGPCAALGGRAVYDLMALCHENGWRLVPDGDDRYVVTTGTSAVAERSDRGGDDAHKGDDGVSGGVAPCGAGWRAPSPPLRSCRPTANIIIRPLFLHNSTNFGGSSCRTNDTAYPHPQCPRCSDRP